MDVTIIGAGMMARGIGARVRAGGNDLEVVSRDPAHAQALAEQLGGRAAEEGARFAGEVVVLAIPYAALAHAAADYGPRLAGKVVVDITNPLNVETFDSLVVPADGSAAAEIAAALPQSRVVKAFNTNFAATLASGTVGEQPTTVLIAGDDADAKSLLAGIVTSGGLRAIDAGSLRRARELEALGFLQITLAAAEKIAWNRGFAVIA
jgi:hypothetical protein